MYLEFIKNIFKKWFGIFSLIATVSGLVLFYTGIDPNNLIVNFMRNNWLTVSLLFLFISAFQVWIDTKKEKLALEDKLKNPVDYEIKAIIRKVTVDFNYLNSLYETNIIEVKELIDEVDKEINSLSNHIEGKSKSKDFERLMSLSSRLSGMGRELKTDELYLSELIRYKKTLEEYLNKKNDYISIWEKFLDNNLKDIYLIDFKIQNTGIKSDEDIDIEILYKNSSKYILDISLLDGFPRANIPTKPERKIYSMIRTNIDTKFDGIHQHMINSNPQTFRRYEETEEKQFSIKLRDLKVSESVRIFRKKGFFILLEHREDIEVKITSKKSTSMINKKVIYDDEGDYDYFKDSNSLLR